jgi:hydrogenase maturation factor
MNEKGWSQQTIILDQKYIRERARENLENHYKSLPLHYEMVVSNLISLRREAWKTVNQTQDSRSKVTLFSVIQSVNEAILEVLSIGDLVLANTTNAEQMEKEARKELKQVKEVIEADNKNHSEPLARTHGTTSSGGYHDTLVSALEGLGTAGSTSASGESSSSSDNDKEEEVDEEDEQESEARMDL